uniref:40S ribosomal protein S12 n=2 Tax=Populus alba TaxID=43335 RepID=A0A4U5QHZ9_POPAL|nr:40S ribosomal protein S12-like isoform X1 [Populus alba]
MVFEMQQAYNCIAAAIFSNFSVVQVFFFLVSFWAHEQQEASLHLQSKEILTLSTNPKMSGEETPAPAQPLEAMDLMTALQLVLKKSLAHGGLARGLHEGAKVIEKHAAQLCVLAEDCNQPDYVKLVKALCADHGVGLLTVPSAKTLGEWAGLCKIDSEGKARKVVGCSCVVVKDYGETSEGYNVVQEHVKSN